MSEMTKPVKTRFAPSPTGFQHIGGMRTAFYAWLLARHYGGKFILRIEDTDQERKVPGAIRFILEELKWFGVDIDEGPSREELRAIGEDYPDAPNLSSPHGPYIQSLRKARYQEVANQLIKLGVAYRCDCTHEMLERERLEQMARREVPGYSGYCRTRDVPADKPHVVRFKMPYKQEIALQDALRGKVVFESASLKDPVLLKSDGLPLYHLAVVCDDHDMGVSHVLRGTEWLPTAPLHWLLYQALGWEPPVFCHLPVVLGSDGKKLSKRHGATSSDIFRKEGYLPEALFNYVVLVGWAPGQGSNQEVFTREDLIKQFTLEGINLSSGLFDYNKLIWMNGLYVRQLPIEEFISRCESFLTQAGLPGADATFRAIAPHIQERVKILTEVPDMVSFLYKEAIDREIDSMLQKGIDASKAKEMLSVGRGALQNLPDFSHSAIDAALRPLAEKFGVKPGPLFMVYRIAALGKKITPPLFESLEILGKDRALKRFSETEQLLG